MENGLNSYPKTVIEFGPGASIGTGLAALIAGAEHYHALDVIDYTNTDLNIQVFDELVELFEARADIPEAIDFPSHLLDDDHMSNVLNQERLKSIRDSLNKDDGTYITYHIPCHDKGIIAETTADFIFTHAVMEHVEDINNYYKNMYHWLKEGGITSHQIDFECHGLADTWNGHWGYSDSMWKVIKGKKLEMLNRYTHSNHMDSMQSVNFEITHEIKFKGENGIERVNLASRFQAISDEDLGTKGSLIVAKKK